MFDFTVPTELVGMCKNAFAQGLNLGNRGKGDGNAREQLHGLIGELVIKHEIFGIAPVISDGNDGGYDFEYGGFKIDIKTKIINSIVQYHHEHNVLDFQRNYNLDGYIFARLNEGNLVLTVCGICRKKDFFEFARLDKAGTIKQPDRGKAFKIEHDTYSVYYNQMQDIKNVNEVKEFICEWRLKRLTKS
jgi:hypothetical protein